MVLQDVSSAIKEVDTMLDPDSTGGTGSNVAVIVVGVIGGLIVVMLVAAGGYMAHKKHQERKKRRNHVVRDGHLERWHYTA